MFSLNKFFPQCAICKEGLLPTDMVAQPNNCLHMFHSTFIDEWLKVGLSSFIVHEHSEFPFKFFLYIVFFLYTRKTTAE